VIIVNWQGIPFHLTIWYKDPVFMLYPYFESVGVGDGKTYMLDKGRCLIDGNGKGF